MKVAIVGSHGVGKTTLFKQICQSYDGELFCIEETARALMGMMNQSTARMTVNERGFFQQVALNHQIWEEVKHQKFVADRCVLDYLAYSDGLPFYGILYDQVKFHLERHSGYDHVIYLPIEFELEVDDIRFSDIDFQKTIDERMVKLLKEFNIKYTEVRGNEDERLEKVKRILSK